MAVQVAVPNPDTPDYGPNTVAYSAGVVAGGVMSIFMALCRATAFTILNLEMTLGSLFTASLNAATWLLGFLISLALCGGIGLLYREAFRRIGGAGPLLGAALGVVHWLAGGVFLTFLGNVHPLIPNALPTPGPFALNLGTVSAAVFFLGHLIFGAVVGAVYKSYLSAMESAPVTEEREMVAELPPRKVA
jgi:hypothetical protein